MSKFLRQYELSVGGGNGSTVIEPSVDRTLRMTFDVLHEWGGTRSMANIAVYGLSRETEGRIFKQYDKVILSAGYVGSIGQIFRGEIKNVLKERNGPDRVTRIFALSDLQTAEKSSMSENAGAGASVVDIIRRCGTALDMPVVVVEEDFSDEPVYARGHVLTGSPVAILREMSDSHLFYFTLESGRLRIQKRGKSLKNSPMIIGQGSGMIGSPEVTEYGVNVAINLDPNIRLGQKIEIDSRTPRVSISSVLYQNIETTVDVGEYVVQEINHIGDSHSDAWRTDITGWRDIGQ